MVAENFDELTRLVCGVVQFQAELEGNSLVASAVNYHHRAVNLLDIAESIVAESGEPADRHIGVEFFADVDVRGEGAFENQGPGLYFCCQLCGDGCTQGPAEDNDIIGGDIFFFGKPLVCGLNVFVGSFFGGGALTVTVASIVKNKAVQSEIVKDVYAVEAVHNISAVAVTKQDGKFSVFGGDIPAGQSQAVAGFESYGFEVQAEFARGIWYASEWFIEE